jgi:protein-S-isoprenylcysteine O-methyltransferase Ste14
MTTLLTVLLSVTGNGWLVLELVLVLRDRRRRLGGTDQDRGTRALNAVLIGGAVVAADLFLWLIGPHSPLRIVSSPARDRLVLAGLLLAWLGLALRVWAIAVLGRSFRTTVEVGAGQDLVARGPYRWVRHPSYTGLLMTAAGFGLACDTWPGLALCLLLPLIALLRRIRVEETVLVATIGQPYRAYQDRTKRLIPGLW